LLPTNRAQGGSIPRKDASRDTEGQERRGGPLDGPLVSPAKKKSRPCGMGMDAPNRHPGDKVRGKKKKLQKKSRGMKATFSAKEERGGQTNTVIALGAPRALKSFGNRRLKRERKE